MVDTRRRAHPSPRSNVVYTGTLRHSLANAGSGATFQTARDTRMPLSVGEIVLDRFMVDRLIGIGGSSVVYRALDCELGHPVAVKVLADRNAASFEREVDLLRRLDDPGIVTYVAHGRTAEGIPVLVTEWLRGTNLAVRLIRRPLSVRESIELIESASLTLASAHAMGVVHNDLKPSNLFLCEESVGGVKLLDFGSARQKKDPASSGVVAGTIGYTAPELIYSEEPAGPGADVFSLGCILFECLTGRPPFVGSSLGAVLVSILSDCPPLVSSFDDELAELDDLLALLLAKDPARRPRDARELLDALSPWRSTRSGPAPEPPAALSGRVEMSEPETFRSFVVAAMPHRPSNPELTPVLSHVAQLESALRARVEPFSGTVAMLSSETFVVTLSEETTARNCAERAAACALAIHADQPDLCTQVICTRSTHERAACSRLAEELRERAADHERAIFLNPMAARLLRERCVIEKAGTRSRLLAFRTDESAIRCVGRERELEFLDQTWSQSIEANEMQRVLIVGEPGAGKTRLIEEWLERARQRRPVRAWRASTGATFTGQGSDDERVAANSRGNAQPKTSRPYGLVCDLIQAARDEAWRAELCANTTDKHGANAAGTETASLVAFEHADEIESDEQALTKALEFHLERLPADTPLMIVLDDLQAADAESSRILERLDGFSRPIVVVGLARPSLFRRPESEWGMWRRSVEVRLRGLPRSASAAILDALIPDEVARETIARLFELSEGTPRALRELIERFQGGLLEGSTLARRGA